MGIDRDGAARISFLMLVPVTAGAVVVKAYGAITEGLPDDVARADRSSASSPRRSPATWRSRGLLRLRADPQLRRLRRLPGAGRAVRARADRHRRPRRDLLDQVLDDLRQLVAGARARPAGSSARRRSDRRAAGRLASAPGGSRRPGRRSGGRRSTAFRSSPPRRGGRGPGPRPGSAASASPIRFGSSSLGAASMKTLPESRSST